MCTYIYREKARALIFAETSVERTHRMCAKTADQHRDDSKPCAKAACGAVARVQVSGGTLWTGAPCWPASREHNGFPVFQVSHFWNEGYWLMVGWVQPAVVVIKLATSFGLNHLLRPPDGFTCFMGIFILGVQRCVLYLIQLIGGQWWLWSRCCWCWDTEHALTESRLGARAGSPLFVSRESS